MNIEKSADINSKIISQINDTPKKSSSKGVKDSSDKVSLGFDTSKGLQVLTKEITKSLNELLITKLPEGLESLNPDDFTSEKTADMIVNGVVALFPAYAKQNPELEGEELINSFMETVKGGIDKGYKQAFSTLEGLKAFEFDGVQSGIEKTMSLVDEKLNAFAAQLIGKKEEIETAKQ